MRKKELLIQILECLLPYRDLAEGFLFLVRESENKEFLDELYTLLLSQMRTIKSQQTKEALQTTIQKLKAKEELQHQKDDEEAEKLFDDLLNTIDE